MSISPETVIEHYATAYHKLYNRPPQELRVLNREWVVVNGARMRLSQLQYVTRQMQLEYDQGKEERRNVLRRLIKWLKT